MFSIEVFSLFSFKGPLSVTYTLTVEVADVNDLSPVCSTSFYSVAVAEDIEVGTNVIQLDCSDLDADSPNNEIVTYVFTSGNEGKFKWAATCNFQQCGILTSVDSDEPVQPPVKLRNSKCCSISRSTVRKYSSDKQRL